MFTRFFLPLVGLVAVFLCVHETATAQLIPVQLTVTGDGGGTEPGTFRAVVGSAQNGATITFDPSVTQITLADTAVSGAAGLTISGHTSIGGNPSPLLQGKSSRILHLSDPAASHRIENLAFENGVVYNEGQNVTSSGGAVLVDGAADLVNTVFTNNYASASATASASANARGGAVFMGGEGDINSSVFTNNYAYADAYASANARGGAVFMGGEGDINSSVFTNNYAYARADEDADAVSANARGGAVFLDGGGDINGSVFTNNYAYASSSYSAEADAASANAHGGAVFLDGGMTTISDSSFTGNYVHATGNRNRTARGGAIFVNTEAKQGADVPLLKLAATAGNQTVFHGNTARIGGNAPTPDGIAFASVDGESMFAILNIEADGEVLLYDPVTANMTGGGASFQMDAYGAGTFTWGGRNTLNAAQGSTVNLQGDTVLAHDFTLASNRLLHVTVGDSVLPTPGSLSFVAARDTDLAMFDFTGAVGGSGLEIVAGSTLDIDTSRQLLDIAEGTEYLTAAGGTVPDAFTLPAGSLIIETKTANGNLYAVLGNGFESGFQDIIDGNINTGSSSGALNKLVSNRVAVSNEQFEAMKTSLHAVTAEYVMSQMGATVDAIKVFQHSALYDYFDDKYDEWIAQSPLRDCLFTSTDTTTVYRAQSPCSPCGPTGCGSSTKTRLWGGYVGNFGTMDRHAGFESYKTRMNGILLGADRNVGRDAAVGVYGGYMDQQTRFRSIVSGVDADGYQFGLMARKTFNRRFTVLGDIGYAHFDNDGYRVLAPFVARGSFKQDALATGFGLEYDLVRNHKCLMTPFFRGRYIYVKQTGLSETGDIGTEMSMDAFCGNSFTTSLGMECSRRIVHHGLLFVPRISAAWTHEYGDVGFDTWGHFNGLGAGDRFLMRSAQGDRDRFELGTDVKIWFSKRFSATLAYDCGVSSHTASHAVGAGGTWTF